MKNVEKKHIKSKTLARIESAMNLPNSSYNLESRSKLISVKSFIMSRHPLSGERFKYLPLPYPSRFKYIRSGYGSSVMNPADYVAPHLCRQHAMRIIRRKNAFS